jgi:hypothetical protein
VSIMLTFPFTCPPTSENSSAFIHQSAYKGRFLRSLLLLYYFAYAEFA